MLRRRVQIEFVIMESQVEADDASKNNLDNASEELKVSKFLEIYRSVVKD